MRRNDVHGLAVPTMDISKLGVADADGILKHGCKTGSRSPGELEITCSTSDVAVCSSSASLKSVVRWRSSLSNRAFSMAMTAWTAKFVTSSICLSVKGRTS